MAPSSPGHGPRGAAPPRADAVPPHLRRYEQVPVTIGMSGARVIRLRGRRAGRGITAGRARGQLDDQDLILKQAGPAAAGELMAEADRTAWLHDAGLPAARVLETGRTDDGAWMLTTALPGRMLAEPWPPAELARVGANVAALLRDLHALPLGRCPFRRDLAVVVDEALDRARAGRVDLDDLDAARTGWSLADLTAALRAQVPTAEDLVVAHGDFCAPNILINPATLTVCGLVDLGRLGIADRHQDLALFVRSVSDPHLNPHLGDHVAEVFLRAYGARVDPGREEFYRLLDEFF